MNDESAGHIFGKDGASETVGGQFDRMGLTKTPTKALSLRTRGHEGGEAARKGEPSAAAASMRIFPSTYTEALKTGRNDKTGRAETTGRRMSVLDDVLEQS